MIASMVVPVYNEEKRLQIYFPRLMQALRSAPVRFECIVVSDGSTDETVSLLHAFKKSAPELRIISYPQNAGKGAALKKGVHASRGARVFYTDIDLSVDLNHILPLAFAALDNSCDICIGSRRISGSKMVQSQSMIRTFLGHGYTAIANMILGTSFSDLTCGFKGFTQDAARKVFTPLECSRWSYDAEVLFLAQKHHLHICELPVLWTNDENSKIKLQYDLLQSFIDLCKIRFRGL